MCKTTKRQIFVSPSIGRFLLISMTAIGNKLLFNAYRRTTSQFSLSLSSSPLKQVGTIQTAYLQWSKWCTVNLWLLWSSSFKCRTIKHLLSWFPFENSSLGRRGSKGGGKEETRTEMLMVRFVLILPRILLTFSGSLSTILSAHPPTVLNTRFYYSISDG